MRLYDTFSAYDGAPCVAVMGMFDGMHAGHRALIRAARNEAEALRAPLVAVTYAEHPLSVLRPQSAPRPLMGEAERLRAMEELGVDAAVVHRFTAELAATGAEEFLRELCACLRPLAVCAGDNHTFGAGGRGDAALITALADELGYRAVILPLVNADGAPVSSSRIRALLAEGRNAEARRLLKNG